MTAFEGGGDAVRNSCYLHLLISCDEFVQRLKEGEKRSVMTYKYFKLLFEGRKKN